MPSKSSNNATRLLEGAYAIRSARDSINYYREFADLYDREYADRLGYIYPAMLAAIYRQYAGKSDTPIADIGCGTGLVAEAIKSVDTPPGIDIDGIDISTEMLGNAKAKNLYRHLYQADLTETTDSLPGNYGSVVSAGTFTFGHLGPELLPQILHLGESGTLYCIGVNSVYYREQGFIHILNTMVEAGQISPPIAEVRKIYDQPNNNKSDSNPDRDQENNDGNSHAADTATVLVYRQL